MIRIMIILTIPSYPYIESPALLRSGSLRKQGMVKVESRLEVGRKKGGGQVRNVHLIFYNSFDISDWGRRGISARAQHFPQ